MVNIMVNKFKTVLKEPEYNVVEQYDGTDSMYFIAKGECAVSVTDEKKNHRKIKTLRPGDYFGEISLMYGCKRTAEVTSNKYSTLAMLSRAHYKELLFEFPMLVEEMKK